MKTETILLILVAGAAVYFFATRGAAAPGQERTTVVVKQERPGLFESIGQLADRAKDALGFGDDDEDEATDLDELLAGL
tara:strand:- start:71 stop:307 length:237 start_codon:yes stop_codon:yes gene_type:complete